MNLNDYKEQYDQLNDKRNLAGVKALEAVKQNGEAIQYVKEQTPEICLTAVRESGYALRYVKEQTPELCLAAVEQNVFALKYVDEDMFTVDDEK